MKKGNMLFWIFAFLQGVTLWNLLYFKESQLAQTTVGIFALVFIISLIGIEYLIYNK